jgi:hypothetical protein
MCFHTRFELLRYSTLFHKLLGAETTYIQRYYHKELRNEIQREFSVAEMLVVFSAVSLTG